MKENVKEGAKLWYINILHRGGWTTFGHDSGFVKGEVILIHLYEPKISE